MNPRRTPSSNFVFTLPGGTEDNDLHVERHVDTADGPRVVSVWEPSPEERAQLATGSNIELTIFGLGVPPLAMGITREQPLSRPQRAIDGDGPRLWTELSQAAVIQLLSALNIAEAEAGIEKVGHEVRELLTAGLKELLEQPAGSE